jgi:two-component system phosphate regulon sensor histidine kinase PhoR
MIEARHLQMRLRPVHLPKMIEDTVAVLQSYAAKSGVTLAVDAPSDLPSVSADEDRIRQVLLNLVDNAIKYSRPEDHVRVEARRQDGEVQISVIDSGLGIPKADLERIFERFYRVDKGRAARKGGRGLGLAIAKHFIEAHGGSITVESEPEKGSAFHFTLLVDEEEA